MPSRVPSRIALVGDYSPEVTAHCAIEKCFALSSQPSAAPVEPRWIPTESIVAGNENALKIFNAIWCVPASPYRNTEGALWAIEYARTRSIPFLGTCGGCQHAILEYARHVLGLANAGHTELDLTTPLPLLSRLHCPLIEQPQTVVITDHPFRSVYGGSSGLESYHCSYGLNPNYEHLFADTALEIVARSEKGEARAFRLKDHPFFIGTQFQPERQGLTGTLHPIIAAFFSAAKTRGAAIQQ